MFLRSSWLPLGIVLVVGGVLAQLSPAVALGVFVLLAGWLAKAWADRSLDHVELQRHLPESRAFPGEEIRLTYRLTNHKVIPLPRIEVRDSLPELLSPPDLDLPPAGAPNANAYTHRTHLSWYERASWSLDLPCPERGYYRLGPARLRSGDGFGIFSKQRDETTIDGIIVYPRTVPLEDLGLPAARPFGESRGRERIFEDPMRFAGLRDYEPGDSLRRIDWKATARRGDLQSRVYEPSTTHHIIVGLNVDTLEHSWQGFLPEMLEANIVVAASVARWAHEDRQAVGLLANGSLPESDRPISIAPGRSPDQLLRILEALGGIRPMTLEPLSELIERESHRLPLGSTLAVVTALMTEPLAAVLRRLRGERQQVVVLSMVDEDWAGLLGDLPVQRMKHEALLTAEAKV